MDHTSALRLANIMPLNRVWVRVALDKSFRRRLKQTIFISFHVLVMIGPEVPNCLKVFYRALRQKTCPAMI